MTVCARCHRPLKRPAVNGLGPVCAKRAQLPAKVERDLFGYDIEAAAAAACERLGLHVEALAAEAQVAMRRAFRAARVRLGVWAR